MGTFVRKSNKVHVVMVLDMSGSMEPQWEETMGGANAYFDGLRANTEVDYSVTIINFDTQYEVVCANKPLSEVPRITKDNYCPRGWTALYDAVGRAIREVEPKVGPTDKAFVVIITDGEENSSREETEQTIRPKIQRLQNQGNWTFVYLGAVDDAWGNARKMGVSRGNTARYFHGASLAAFESMTKGTVKYCMSNDVGTRDFYSTYAPSSDAITDVEGDDDK